MFRRFLILGIAALALVVALDTSGQLYAQHGGGGSHHGFRVGRNGFSPGFRNGLSRGFGFDSRFGGGFAPGVAFDSRFGGGFTPGLGFAPGFSGAFFEPRFSRGRFDRFDDGFSIDRRFRGGFFNPQFIR